MHSGVEGTAQRGQTEEPVPCRVSDHLLDSQVPLFHAMYTVPSTLETLLADVFCKQARTLRHGEVTCLRSQNSYVAEVGSVLTIIP